MEEKWFERKKKLILLAFIFSFILLVLFLFEFSQSYQTEIPEGKIEFHFIDAGQADSTLILQEDIVVLVDSGDWQRRDVVDYLSEINVSKIDLIIGTHPHADHIGQMDKILSDFEVIEVWMSGYKQDSNLYKIVYEEIENQEVIYREPRAGEKYFLGNLEIDILNPVRLTRDIHESSLAFKVSFGNFSVMFTGDVESKTEIEILKKNRNILINIFSQFFSQKGDILDVVIYQLGHHGSKTSSTKDFLEAMSPEIGVYSAGKGNSYGHPDLEVVERFKEMNIPLYGTDEYGTLIFVADSKGNFKVVNKSI